MTNTTGRAGRFSEPFSAVQGGIRWQWPYHQHRPFTWTKFDRHPELLNPGSLDHDFSTGPLSTGPTFPSEPDDVEPVTGPTMVSTPPAAIRVGDELNYQARAFDAGTTAFSYYLESAPSGMRISRDTGVITWSPGQSGRFEVVVCARSWFGQVARQRFVLAVCAAPPRQAPAAPTVRSVWHPPEARRRLRFPAEWPLPRTAGANPWDPCSRLWDERDDPWTVRSTPWAARTVPWAELSSQRAEGFNLKAESFNLRAAGSIHRVESSITRAKDSNSKAEHSNVKAEGSHLTAERPPPRSRRFSPWAGMAAPSSAGYVPWAARGLAGWASRTANRSVMRSHACPVGWFLPRAVTKAVTQSVTQPVTRAVTRSSTRSPPRAHRPPAGAVGRSGAGSVGQPVARGSPAATAGIVVRRHERVVRTTSPPDGGGNADAARPAHR